MRASRCAITAAAVLSVLASFSIGCAKTTDTASGSSVTTTADGSGQDQKQKKVFKEDQTDIKVVVGETFAIRLPQNPSIGDSWQMISAPDDSFVKADGSSMKYDSADPKPGEGGQIEFKFKAKKAGPTSVTLFNCYRCGAGSSVSPENSALAKRLTFDITVS